MHASARALLTMMDSLNMLNLVYLIKIYCNLHTCVTFIKKCAFVHLPYDVTLLKAISDVFKSVNWL